MNIIADVAGQFEALERLMKKMPADAYIFLGDLCDRGPDSHKVIELARRHTCLLGNHEHMLYDHCRGQEIYGNMIYESNGGGETIKAYGGKVPDDVLDWIKNLPMYWQDGDVFLSHAPWKAGIELEHAAQKTIRGPMNTEQINGNSLIWNRSMPEKREKFQFFGHNSHWGLKFLDFADPYALCMDDSRLRNLTGVHYNEETKTLENIYQEAF